ncbi:MAG: WG repeat-containing protein [Saprospiraceae bacterium]
MLRIILIFLFPLVLTAQELEEVKEPTAQQIQDWKKGKIEFVQQGKLHGFNNPDGSVRIPVIYENLERTPCSFMITKLNGKYGVIDDLNQVLIPFGEYEMIERNEGFSIERDENLWLEKAKNQELIGLWAKKNGKYGVINPNGRVLIDIKYEGIKHVGKGYYAVTEGDKWVIMNKQNQIILDRGFDRIEDLYGDYSKVCVGHLEGLLKIPDTLLLEPIYDRIQSGGWPFIDAQKDSIVWQYHRYDRTFQKSNIKPTKIFYTLPFNPKNPLCDGYKCIVKHSGIGYGVVGQNSTMIIPPLYDYVMASPYCTWFIATKNQKRGLLNREGVVILPFTYQYLQPCAHSDSLLQANTGNDWYFIKPDGTRISEENYTRIEQLQNGWFAVSRDHIQALVDPDGHRITDFVYRAMLTPPTDQYVAFAIKGEKQIAIDKMGKEFKRY